MLSKIEDILKNNLKKTIAVVAIVSCVKGCNYGANHARHDSVVNHSSTEYSDSQYVFGDFGNKTLERRINYIADVGSKVMTKVAPEVGKAAAIAQKAYNKEMVRK